jgi:hypothetical protein
MTLRETYGVVRAEDYDALAARLAEALAVIEEQRLTIGALNMVIGGAGSTTTENLRTADSAPAAPVKKGGAYCDHRHCHIVAVDEGIRRWSCGRIEG